MEPIKKLFEKDFFQICLKRKLRSICFNKSLTIFYQRTWSTFVRYLSLVKIPCISMRHRMDLLIKLN